MIGYTLVAGYAGLDHVMRVAALPDADRTAVVEQRVSKPWPRQGGCAPNIARGLVGAGADARLIAWFGNDREGTQYLRDLQNDGVETDSSSIVEGGRTPETYIFYAADGSSMCFYDSGNIHASALSDAQRTAASEADWLCVTVGPEQVTESLLEVIPDSARVAWSVKADPDAFPPELVRQLLQRSSVLAFSRGERPFLEHSTSLGDPLSLMRSEALAVETRADKGVMAYADSTESFFPVDPVTVEDPTGAGDAFFAGLLAPLIKHSGDYEMAVASGIGASRQFLWNRLEHRSIQ